MAALKGLVEFQLTNANELSTLLDREQLAITQRNAKNIETLAAEKVILIERLQQTDQRIARHPEIASLKSDPELSQLVEQIKIAIEHCQKTNLTNGEALQRAQLSFNKLNNLMKQSQGKFGMTYNAEGQTRNFSTLGTNIKA
ncbi:flagellar protein FlgN [Vibrio sinensis]|uniref:Flagellar protein FlgN n=1 Tax=Vibrio sinensis TaxID=2302434 RepID=A0A3A6QRI0_9VIBR|nr:flagellar export chaperone FlgN [Vibrio sinensis]RJX71635.1 flagellar protein FlgN [Vibrio sinensis]